jgi:uncharacterized protein with GYD domain
MPTYIMLLNFTDQGIRNIKDSPKRADAFKNTAKKAGATVKEVFWTLGQYDVVTIVEAPDDVISAWTGYRQTWKRAHADAARLLRCGYEETFSARCLKFPGHRRLCTGGARAAARNGARVGIQQPLEMLDIFRRGALPTIV